MVSESLSRVAGRHSVRTVPLCHVVVGDRGAQTSLSRSAARLGDFFWRGRAAGQTFVASHSARASLQELAKKVLFTSLLGFVGRGKVLQVIFGLVLSFFLVMIYQAVGPFASRATNRVGLSSSIALFLYLMLALMLKVKSVGSTLLAALSVCVLR